jgi:hypothetical protein
MRGQILRITMVMLCGLTIGFGWGAARLQQLGEAVPDDQAATQRGGDCTKNWACALVSPKTAPTVATQTKTGRISTGTSATRSR